MRSDCAPGVRATKGTRPRASVRVIPRRSSSSVVVALELHVSVSPRPANARWPRNAKVNASPPAAMSCEVTSTCTSATVRSRTQFTYAIPVRTYSVSQSLQSRKTEMVSTCDGAATVADCARSVRGTKADSISTTDRIASIRDQDTSFLRLGMLRHNRGFRLETRGLREVERLQTK